MIMTAFCHQGDSSSASFASSSILPSFRLFIYSRFLPVIKALKRGLNIRS
jgi:hypothetical protein